MAFTRSGVRLPLAPPIQLHVAETNSTSCHPVRRFRQRLRKIFGGSGNTCGSRFCNVALFQKSLVTKRTGPAPVLLPIHQNTATTPTRTIAPSSTISAASSIQAIAGLSFEAELKSLMNVLRFTAAPSSPRCADVERKTSAQQPDKLRPTRLRQLWCGVPARQ
jgi:hypothetical protein